MDLDAKTTRDDQKKKPLVEGSDDKFTNGILVGLPQNGKYFLHNHVTLERDWGIEAKAQVELSNLMLT